jgi:hypothetical protein
MLKSFFAGLLFLIACLNLSGQCQGQVIENVIIYKKKGVYACFPSLLKAEYGTLVTTFGTRTFKSHHDNTGGTETLESKDQGHTWKAADKKYIDPVYRQADGRIVIPAVDGWKRVLPAQASRLKSKGIQVDRNNGNYFYAVGAFLKISQDGGQSWQKRELDLPPLAILMGFNSSSYLRTSSGISLSAVYGKLQPSEKSQVFSLRSDDGGKTWKFSPMASSSPEPDKYLGFNETALAETDDGKIVAMLRGNPESGDYLFSSVSQDKGRTWSVPQQTSVWGYPANLLSYEGKLICTYGYRRAPMGVRVSVFTDNFVKPSGPEIILRSDATGSPSDLGYPITVALGNGEFFTIYYITGSDGVTHVAGTRWKLAN